MKKSLLALAVLSAFAGVASAQSSVTLTGALDVNGRYNKTDGLNRRLSENNSGLNSSRLTLRGVEDLGGGLNAGFLIESELLPDTGAAGDVTRNKFWNRQSFVKLGGNWGEIRLGRDYTPSFYNQSSFDIYGTLGLGNAFNVHQLYSGTRIDNSIGYLLPSNLGGFYGQAMVAAGEGGSTQDRPGRYLGGRIGFAAGPLDVAFGAGQQRFAVNFSGIGNPLVGAAVPLAGAAAGYAAVAINAVAIPIPAGSTQKTYNAGVTYNFGFLKLMGSYDRDTVTTWRENVYEFSGSVPIGQGEFKAGYIRSKLSNSVAGSRSNTVDQISAGYIYNLSKRTALYTHISRIDNKDTNAASCAASPVLGVCYRAVVLPSQGSVGAATSGGKSQGAEFGIRHFF